MTSRPPMSDEPTDALVTGKNARWFVQLHPAAGEDAWQVWARREDVAGLTTVGTLRASENGYTLSPRVGVKTAGQEWELLIRDLLERLH